jgi:hypothetical protein
METKNEKSIARKISLCMSELGTLHKTGRIELKGGGSYPVLQESDIYAPVAAALVKHGLVLWPSVLSCDRHTAGVDVLLRVVLEDTDSGETREIQGPGSAPIKDNKETTVATGAAMKNCLRRLFLICTEEDEHAKVPRTQQTRQTPRPAQPAQSAKGTGDDVTIERLSDCKILEVNETTKDGRRYVWVRIVTADGRTLQCIADDPKIFPSLQVGRGEVELRRSPSWKYARVTGATIEVAR